jgi:dihydroflavonol-4-reductase
MKVLVTGATGFVGLRLLSHLREAGVFPMALVRKSSQTDAIEAEGFPIYVADLATGAGLEEALSNCDAVVHSAGGGRVKRASDFYKNNTQTTETLLQAITTHCPSLKRFVLISSIAARGPGTTKEPMGPQSHYGKSKALAEEKALACQTQFPITILRPPSLYGPGDARFLPLYKAVHRGLVTLPSSQGEASFLHIDDMCQAVVSALRTPHPGPCVFELDDGKTYEISSLIHLIQGGLDVKKPRLIHIPHTVLWTVAVCLEAAGALTGKATLLTRDKMKDLRNPHWVTRSDSFQDATGWRPQISLEKGVTETATWYKEQGWLP